MLELAPQKRTGPKEKEVSVHHGDHQDVLGHKRIAVTGRLKESRVPRKQRGSPARAAGLLHAAGAHGGRGRMDDRGEGAISALPGRSISHEFVRTTFSAPVSAARAKTSYASMNWSIAK